MAQSNYGSSYIISFWLVYMIAILVKLIVHHLITRGRSELVAGYSVNIQVVLCFLFYSRICNLIYGVLYYYSFLWRMVPFCFLNFSHPSLSFHLSFSCIDPFLLGACLLPRYRWDQLIKLCGEDFYLCFIRYSLCLYFAFDITY